MKNVNWRRLLQFHGTLSETMLWVSIHSCHWDRPARETYCSGRNSTHLRKPHRSTSSIWVYISPKWASSAATMTWQIAAWQWFHHDHPGTSLKARSWARNSSSSPNCSTATSDTTSPHSLTKLASSTVKLEKRCHFHSPRKCQGRSEFIIRR